MSALGFGVLQSGLLLNSKQAAASRDSTPHPDRPQPTTNRQHLYDQLRASYRRPSRPSGLTLVDSVAVKQSKQSW